MKHTIILLGKLGRDPEMRYTSDGKPVTTFSLAVNDYVNKEKVTAWFKVTVWGNRAETANQYLKKGSSVQVIGKLQFDKETGGPRLWDDKNGKARSSFEVTADDVVFISGNATSEPKAEIPSEEDLPF